MSEVTVLGDSARTVEGRWVDGRAVIPATALPAATDWELKPEGLCRDDVCVPVPDPAAIRHGDDMLDLAAIAQVLDRPAVIDERAGLVAIGQPSSSRRAALRDRTAPDFSLHDLNDVPHTLAGWTGKKRLLVAFSSW